MILRVVFMLFATLFSAEKDSYLVVLEKRIAVRGNTSIGSFNCQYEAPQKSDTLFFASGGYLQKPYLFDIPIEVFQCGNFLLNKDFQKTLKSKEYPRISVRVMGMEQNRGNKVIGELQLIIAGKSREMGMVSFSRTYHDEMEMLSADIKLLVSDFDLEPPKRLGSMIRTDDIMYIDVDLVLNNK